MAVVSNPYQSSCISLRSSQVSAAYQTPRFIEGRITGFKSTLRSAAGEKNFLETFVKRSAYEWELLLNESLLSFAFGGVQLGAQRNKTYAQVSNMANDNLHSVKGTIAYARRTVMVAAQALVPLCNALRFFMTLDPRIVNPALRKNKPNSLDSFSSKAMPVVERACQMLFNLSGNSLLEDLLSNVYSKCLRDLSVSKLDVFMPGTSPKDMMPMRERGEHSARDGTYIGCSV